MDYAEERIGRAREFAARQKRGATEILLEWWRQDQAAHAKRSHPSGGQRSHHGNAPLGERSYDLEEFFLSALANAYEGSEAEEQEKGDG